MKIRKNGFLVPLLGFALSILFTVSANARSIVLEIDYGQLRPARTATVEIQSGDTALMALMSVAAVSTYPVGHFVFVTAVDGVEGKRGKTAWYYSINGKPAALLAYRQVLEESAKHMRWTFQKDVCSEKVDKPKVP